MSGSFINELCCPKNAIDDIEKRLTFMPKQDGKLDMTINAVSDHDMTPQKYDGIFFYPTPNQMYFEYFCLKGKRAERVETDFIPCLVSLFSIQDNNVEHFETFRANFSDPREYANMLRKQTQMFGIIIKDVKKAKTFIKNIERDGEEMKRELITKRMKEEYKRIPLWSRIKMWFGIYPVQEE